jgi:hypothetical protein
MSLELLAHIELVVMHEAVEAMQRSFLANLSLISGKTLRLRQLVWALSMAQWRPEPQPAPPVHAIPAAAAAIQNTRPQQHSPVSPITHNQPPQPQRLNDDIVFFTDSMEVAQEEARRLVARDWLASPEDMTAWQQRAAVIGPDPKTGAVRVWIGSVQLDPPTDPVAATSMEQGEWAVISD